jgi:hypothetical protein
MSKYRLPRLRPLPLSNKCTEKPSKNALRSSLHTHSLGISSPSRQAQRTTEWRNSPNAYLRQEVEETGTPNPKKVTKVRLIDLLLIFSKTSFAVQWVPDTGLKHSTPIKIDTKHQFAPSNLNSKELKSHQKQVMSSSLPCPSRSTCISVSV